MSSVTTYGGGIALAGIASDNEGVGQVSWSVDTGASGTASMEDGGWSVARVPLALGSNTITVTAHDLAANQRSVTVAVVRRAGFTGWQSERFTAEMLADPVVSGPSADANQNGIANLLEYALGGDPVASTAGQIILPTVQRNVEGNLELSFTRFADREDVILTVTAAESLAGDWNVIAKSVNGAPFVSVDPTSAVVETGSGIARSVTVTDGFTPGVEGVARRFLRLEIAR